MRQVLRTRKLIEERQVQTYGELYAQRLSDGLVVRLARNEWEDGPIGLKQAE